MLFMATLRIMVLAKSTPTYVSSIDFIVMIIKIVIFRQIKIMVLEKSRPTISIDLL